MTSLRTKLVAIGTALALTAGVPQPTRAAQPSREEAERLKTEMNEFESFLPGDAPTRATRDSVEKGNVDERVADVARATTDRARKIAASAPAVVVSGGISLGAYQAGFISALVRYWSVVARDDAARGEKRDPLPRVWTGASAGAVNALLGGLASCDPAFRAERWSPEETLFWRIWIDRLDLDRILPESYDGRTDHLFSSPYMQASIDSILEAAKGTTFTPGCSFAFGVTATNLSGRDVPLGVGDRPAHLKRVTEKLVVQLSATEGGKLAARLPLLNGAPGASLPYIEVNRNEFEYYSALGTAPGPGGGQPVSLETLFKTPQASGAFPMAFPPVDVEVSVFNGGVWQPAKPLQFVDGGFLNNNPLDLAHRLGLRWREGGDGGFDAATFPVVYLDQDIVEWEWKKRGTPRKPLSPLEKTYFQHMGTLFAAARDSVILDTLENEPALSGRVQIPRRTSVLPSEFRFAMMGFVDRRFREHDFYRGILDAVRFLGRELASTRSVRRRSEADIRAALGISTERFACVADGACSGEPVRELGKVRGASDRLTRRASAGTLEDDDLDALLSELGKDRYAFSEGVMSGQRATGSRGDLQPLRARVGRGFLDLVDNQNTGQRVALRPAGTAFLDQWLTYAPPTHTYVLGLSRSHGVTAGIERPFWAREERAGSAYDRSELRLGVSAGGAGRRDMDQLDADDTRLRAFTAGVSLDYVSDLDAFSGKAKWLRWLQLGPYARWRAGVGAYASYLRSPAEWSYTPELRVGLDLVETVGVRLTVPVAFVRDRAGEELEVLGPRFSEIGVSLEILLTQW